jgi:hypothetical protein
MFVDHKFLYDIIEYLSDIIYLYLLYEILCHVYFTYYIHYVYYTNYINYTYYRRMQLLVVE